MPGCWLPSTARALDAADADRRQLCARLGLIGTLPLWASAPVQALTTRPEPGAPPARLKVGPQEAIRTLAAAAAQAAPGTVVEVQAGDYPGDVAVWPQHDLTLRAIGGRVRVIANGAHAQGKGLFVCTGERQRIEGFDFIGARVPDRNGAGIRLERGSLSLKDCRFHDNENGLLSANDPSITLDIDGCDFGAIAPGEGRTHNCYVGAIARLSVTGSYFHHGHSGHLLKSRAAVHHIFYNRFSDETGSASFELEFPNGGLALVVGNLIQQSPRTDNFHLIAYGNEGLTGPRHELHLINNTLIDLRQPGGVYLRAAPGAQRVRLINNLLAGQRSLPPGAGWEQHHNHFVGLDHFVDGQSLDARLRADSPLRGRAVEPGRVDGIALRPTRQYQHPCGLMDVPPQTPYSPGAFQV